VIIAAIFLSEQMTTLQIIGGVLVLGATFLSEKFEIKESEEGPTPTTTP
jgi:drug/metabolite transporter (DMT)-like permease